MKRHFLWMAVMVLFAAGCSSPYSVDIDEPIREDNKKAKEIIITASFDNQSDAQTKTVLNADGKVEWTPGDEIVIFSDGESAKFTSINTENARKANFRGTISFVTGATEGSDPDAFVYGLYPYDASATMSGGVITTTIPSSQVGLAGSFADDLALAVAKSVSTNLSFKNAYSGIDFEFSEEGYETVTLSSNNGELIAGKVTVSFGSDGIPVTTVDANGSSSITLTAPGGGTFETGKRYYIVCAPQTLDGGYTLTAEKSTGRAVFERASKKEFKRNVLTDVSGYLNERATFESLNITFADANVKAICVAPATGWDTNGDGELSYTEAAAVTTIPYGVFSDNTTITSFDEFQYFTSVPSLGYDSDYDEGMDYYGAFSYCSALKSIILPPSLHDISYGAFRGCSSLETITIPATVTRIGQVAFDGCTNLEVIMESETPCTLYPDSYGTYPGETCAFGLYDNEVKAILVPTDESVTAYKTAQYWSDFAFLIHKIGWIDPTELITFQDAIVELYCVDRWDTNGDERLSKAEAAAVTDIGTTFQGVDITSFDELKYFTGITTIPASAFSGCMLLESLSFPPQISSIGSRAFANTNKLKKITVPSLDLWLDVVCSQKPFESSGGGELYIDSNLVTEFVVPNERTIVPSGMCSYLKLESVQIHEGVTEIRSDAFLGCTVPEINIPNGVTSIGSGVFSKSNIVQISFPNSVTSIGAGAFQNASKLKRIFVPSIDEWLVICSSQPFRYSENGELYVDDELITEFTIPSEWTSIPSYMFNYLEMESVHIHEGVTNIKYAAFLGCTVPEIIIPESVTDIGGAAFADCKGLTSISIPAGVLSLGVRAFSGCTGLSNIYFSEGITKIQGRAFEGCSSLKKISLPKTVTVLWTENSEETKRTGAFLGSSIENIECYDTQIAVVSRDYPRLMWAFFEFNNQYVFNTQQVKSITVKRSGVTYSVADWVFSRFPNLESVTLQNGLTSVGKSSFESCSHLTQIELPATIRYIGGFAFSGCSSLTSIKVNSTTPPSGTVSMFTNTNNAPIYVPASSVDDYKAADGWSTYASRIQAIP